MWILMMGDVSRFDLLTLEGGEKGELSAQARGS